MFAVGVGPGDEVIVPTYTWIASIAPALLLHARPVLCDIDPHTLLLDAAAAKKKINKKTRAIVVVHLWGNVCDMDAFMALSKETGVAIIEDCSHSHGATWRGRPCGSIGAVGAWSLQGAKPLSAGEGGVVTTNDPTYYERICWLGQINRGAENGLDMATPSLRASRPLGLGFKLRAHPVAVGIASVQLTRLNAKNANRKKWCDQTALALKKAGILGIIPVHTHTHAERGGFYAFPLLFDAKLMPKSLTLAKFVADLQQAGVDATGSSRYPLLHRLPLFAKGADIFGHGRGPITPGKNYKGYKEGDFPVAEKVYDRIVFLPCLSDAKDGAVEKMVEIIAGVVQKYVDSSKAAAAATASSSSSAAAAAAAAASSSAGKLVAAAAQSAVKGSAGPRSKL